MSPASTRFIRLGRIALPLCVLLAFVASPPAQADGDPASDFLVSLDTYTGIQAPPATATDLNRAVAKAFASGYRVKVAVVSTRADLGAIPSLFGKPGAYAKFLGLELRQFYAGPLLIVMRKGFGIYDAGRSTAAETRALASVPLRGTTAAELTAVAAGAVTALTRTGALRSKDIVPPSAYPQFARVTPGSPVNLTYRVLEDSERSSDTITVYSNDTVIATYSRPLARITFSMSRSIRWTAPETLPENLRWCVVAKDVAGNTGKPACLALRAG